jgi:hypothetical protein
MRWWKVAISGVVWSGCDPDDGAIVSNGGIVLAGSAQRTVVTASAENPAAPLVRRVNALGVAVPEGATSVEVDGAPAPVSLDAWGYGTLALSGSGTLRVPDAEGEEIHLPSAVWSPPALPRAAGGLAVPGAVEPGRRGVIASLGSSLWWVGVGLPPHAVATLPAQVRGLRSRNVDADGVVDTLAWGGDTVLALRGRDGGGAAWGSAWRAEGWTAIAADVGDADADGAADVLLVWDTGSGFVLQLWAGDGIWGFEPVFERLLAGTALDVAIADDSELATPTLTVLIEGEPWQRFVQTSDGGYAVTGPPVETGATPGSALRAPGDMNGDGGGELVVVPPRVAQTPRSFAIWDLVGEQPLVVTVEEAGATYTFAESSGDTLPDLWMLEDGSRDLSILVHDGGGFVTRDSGQIGHFGPIAAVDTDADQAPDLLVASEQGWSWWRGTRDDEAGGRWRPEVPAGFVYDVGLVGPIVWVDLEPGVDEILGVTTFNGAARLTRYSLGAEGPRAVSQVALPGTTIAGVDLEVCGSVAWLSTGVEVVAVDLQLEQEIGRAKLESRGVGCGEAPDGVAAAVAGPGGITVFGPTASVLRVEPATDAQDVLVGPSGVQACTGRCGWWPGSAGTLPIRAEGGTLILGDGASALRLPGGPDFAVQDVDADGRADLVSRGEGGFVAIWRAAGRGLTAPLWQHGGGTWQGSPVYGSLPEGDRGWWFRRDDALVRTR